MSTQISIPENWNQLSDKQLENIAYQFFCFRSQIKDNAESIEENAIKLHLQLCKELLRCNAWKKIKIALREIHPKKFKKFTSFLYDSIDRTKFIASIKIGDTTFYGPDQRLRNSTIAEFAFADVCFYKYKQTNNIIWLNVLCASLYREANTTPTDIDVRKPFVKEAVDKRADVFESFSLPTKLAIAYTYEGCRNHIQKTFPIIFPPSQSAEETTTQQKYVSFGEIIIDKIQGDPSKLKETNNVMLYTFLSIVQTDINNLRKIKK